MIRSHQNGMNMNKWLNTEWARGDGWITRPPYPLYASYTLQQSTLYTGPAPQWNWRIEYKKRNLLRHFLVVKMFSINYLGIVLKKTGSYCMQFFKLYTEKWRFPIIMHIKSNPFDRIARARLNSTELSEWMNGTERTNERKILFVFEMVWKLWIAN